MVALQLLFTYAPFMQAVFQTRALDLHSWSVIGTLAGSRASKAGTATLGLEATPSTMVVSPVERLKARAVSSYVSQLRALGAEGLSDLTRPERLWDLHGACGGVDGG